MNSIAVKESMPVVSRSSLRKGQASLYDLIVAKSQSNKALTLDEAKNIWVSSVHSNIIDGIPHQTVYTQNPNNPGHWYPRNEKMSVEAVNIRVIDWLMRNIGALVLRGYLKAIPMISLEPQATINYKEK